MTPITDHFDGFGLNDSIEIRADERDTDNGNGSHRYDFMMEFGSAPAHLGYIQFQHGPRNEPGSTPGVTGASVIAMLLDHYRGFQGGPYACRENALIITKLEEALLWSKKRAFDRAAQGVLGKRAVHAPKT